MTKPLAPNRSAGPVSGLLVDILLGFTLGRMGFASWTELHAMFTLRNPRPILSFGSAVALLVPFYRWAERRTYMPNYVLSKETVLGALLFGAGWAVGGVCPGSVLVQFGQGSLMILIPLAGICLGIGVYPKLHHRFFLNSPNSACSG